MDPNPDGHYVLYAAHLADRAEQQGIIDTLRQEAQIWAQESKAQKATVHAVYELLTKGQFNAIQPF